MYVFRETSKSSPRGIVLPLVAICCTLLLALLAMMLNTGWIEHKKSQAQAAVDAAALAAAAALPNYNTTGNRAQVDALAQMFNGSPSTNSANLVMGQDPAIGPSDLQFFNYNGSNTLVPASPPRASAVQVSKQYRVEHLLGGFLPNLSTDINVSSVAVLGGPDCSWSRLPIALFECTRGSSGPPTPTNYCVPSCDGVNNTNLVIQYGQATTDTAGWFRITPPGGSNPSNAQACRDYVNNPPSDPEGRLCLGSYVNLMNGTATSCLSEIIDEIMDHDGDPADITCESGQPAGTCTLTQPWLMHLPVISCEDLPTGNQNANQIVRISGFSKVALTQIISHGSNHEIHFNRICETMPNTAGGGIDCGLHATAPTIVR